MSDIHADDDGDDDTEDDNEDDTQVKAGDPAARSQLLRSQCGFEKSLPKVNY